MKAMEIRELTKGMTKVAMMNAIEDAGGTKRSVMEKNGWKMADIRKRYVDMGLAQTQETNKEEETMNKEQKTKKEAKEQEQAAKAEARRAAKEAGEQAKAERKAQKEQEQAAKAEARKTAKVGRIADAQHVASLFVASHPDCEYVEFAGKPGTWQVRCGRHVLGRVIRNKVGYTVVVLKDRRKVNNTEEAIACLEQEYSALASTLKARQEKADAKAAKKTAKQEPVEQAPATEPEPEQTEG